MSNELVECAFNQQAKITKCKERRNKIMTTKEAIEFTEKMLKEQKHWLNKFIYMNKTRYSDYTSEIKNKRYCVNYLKYILKILKGIKK